ncbi:DUF3237 domain-containing protein [Leptobacterium sp. I13]|uniref:DUF3237 domain-containing protein n=1 Tax=Leptobacterium meishanense TaxID=3128904 RepID=UPI0030EC2F81
MPKKIIYYILIALSLIYIQHPIYAQELESEFLFELQIAIDTPIPVGKTLKGTRTIYPIKGGTFEGPEIKGKILPNGGDWMLSLDENTSKLDVKAVVETEDGALIYMTYTGYIHKNPDNSFYVRILPLFETSVEKYAWLNHTVAVGKGRFTEGGVAYKIYAIK